MNSFQWWSLYCRSQIRSCGSLQFIGSVLGGSAIALTAPIICQSAWAATLSNWSYNPDSHEFQVTLPEGITPRYFLMAEPARIVMDLPGVEVGAVQTQASYAGAVRQIRVAQFESGLARVVIEFAPGTVLEPRQAELRRSGDQWILRPLIADSTVPATPVAAQTTAPESEATAPTDPSTVATAPPPTPTAPALPFANPLDQPIAPAPVVDSANPADSRDVDSQPEIPSANVSVEDDLTAEIRGLALPVESPPAAVEPEPSATVTSERVETSLGVDLPTAPSSSSQSESAENADTAAPIEIAVPEPPPSPVATEAVAAEEIADIPAPTLGASESDASTTDAPTTTARVAVPDLPVLEAEEPASENVPVASVSQAPVQTSERSEASEGSEREHAIAQQPTNLPDASDLPSVTFPAPNLPSGNGQVRVPAPTAPRVRPTPVPAASLDTTEATGSAADLVLPPTGISTRPDGFSPQSITQPPIAGTEVVRVPDLPPLPTTTPPDSTPANSENSITAEARDGSVPFGQPLPEPSAGQTVATVDANIWLPANTVLNLQYPREQELTLDPQVNWQEVLVLSQDVVHPQTGQVILPTGTQVVGRFETGRQGSRFIAQAVSIGNRNVKLAAESASIDGDRNISDQDLLLNSGIGAAAATVIGGFSGIGLLAGIAAGAATTYVTAPQPAVIQPYQMIEVRVLEDVTHSDIAQIQ